LAVAAVVAANTYKPPPPKYPEYKAEEPAAYKPAPPAYNKPAYKEEYVNLILLIDLYYNGLNLIY